MTKASTAVAAMIIGSAQVLAGQGLGTITGTVRDSAGIALSDAEVILANKRVLTTSQGGFRLDSVPVGSHIITVRRVGYAPLRTPIVIRTGSWHHNFTLRLAAPVLPTLYVEARRAGIYGTVGDSSQRPIPGVKVQLAGRGGGETLTDSVGRFAFPSASEGQYVVRTSHPGFAEYRLFVELKKREGKELAIRLRGSDAITSRVDDVAIFDLGRRLVANLRGDRFNAAQLERYGSLGLCDVKGIAARLKAPERGLTIILNGTVVLEEMSVRDLCSWHADEVELVEFGDTVCRDVTRTLPDMLNVWCARFTKQPEIGPPGPPQTAAEPGRGRVRTQRQGGPFIVIWERR
jgi:hypothetical protein